MQSILDGMVVEPHPTTNVLVLHSIIALQLPRESKFSFCESTTILTKFGQFPKILSPILDTVFGIVIEFRAEHQVKAQSPMVVTPSGIDRLVKP